jgi:hypothetical protein
VASERFSTWLGGHVLGLGTGFGVSLRRWRGLPVVFLGLRDRRDLFLPCEDLFSQFERFDGARIGGLFELLRFEANFGLLLFGS